MAKKKQESQTLKASSSASRISNANENIEQEKLIATLRENEKRYRSFIENFQGIAFEADAKTWTPIFFHGAVEEITGYTEEEFTAGNPRWDEIIHPDDLANLRGKDEVTNEPNYSVEREYRIIHKDGRERWVRELVRNVSDERGRISQIQGTIYDITEKTLIEEALQKSEEQFRDLVETALIGVAIANLDGDILYVNDTLLEKLEYKTFEEFVNQKGGSAEKYKDPQARRMLLEKLKEYGQVENYEVELLTKSDKGIYFLMDCTKDGDLMYCTFVDITERKQAGDQLRFEKDFTDTALNAQLDTFFLFELDSNKALRWNQAFKDVSGYSDEEIEKMPTVSSYYSQEDMEKATTFLQKVMEEGTGTIELELICKDGSKAPTEYKVSVIKDKDGEPKYIISIGRDITERRQAQQALQESERRYRTVADFTYDWEYWIDPDGRFRYVSPSCERITGYSPEEFIDSPQLRNEIVAPESIEDWEEHKRVSRSDPKAHELVYAIRRKDGGIRWIEHICQPVIDEEGNSLGSRTSNRDITMRKHIEERLQRRTHDLAERVKELNCLYQFSRIIETPGISLEEIFQGTVELIPTAWQYPEITCARLAINGFVFTTEKFKETKWKLVGDIPIGGSSTGFVEVFYLEERPEADIGPFMREEQDLLDAIGERLGGVLQRRHAEEALIYREKRLQSFFDHAALGISISDPNGNYLQVNKQYVKMFGYEDESELFQKTVVEITHPDDREETRESQKKLASGEISYFRHEKRCLCKDGSIIWGDVSVSPIKDINGEIYAFTVMIVDITERKLAEEALSWSEEKFSKAFMLSPNLMAITSLSNGEIKDVNEGYVKTFGYSREELIGSRTSDLGIWNNPNDRETFIRGIEQNGSVHNLEIEVKSKSGEIRTILLSGEVLDIKSEDPLVVTMGSDITDRKQVEEEIRRLNEELEQRVVERTAELEATNKELEAFAYSISHDLRAPLRAINSFSSVLKEKYADLLGKEGSDYLDKVVTSTIKMDQLINDLLALSRLGRQEFKRTTTNLTYIAKQVFNDMAVKEPNRDIQLEISDLPLVKVDAKLMEVMLNNLISNAVKFTRGRTPGLIEFGCISEGETPTFFLRDNGVGFDMKYAHRLFSPFQRLHTEREFEGTGIGLAIVQRIVNCHGGKVWVEAERDKGSTFFFTLE